MSKSTKNALTRSGDYSDDKHTFNVDVQKFSFSQRVINHWNALTQHAVDCNIVNSFKRCVDHYIRDKGYL